MKFRAGDKLILAGIECKVAFVNAKNEAYLTPEDDGDSYNNQHLLKGLVFAKLDPLGKDSLGNKAKSLPRKSGAV